MTSLRKWLRVARLLAVAAVVACGGCASIPTGRAAIDRVSVHGAKQLDGSDVEDKLATMPSTKFLGFFRGVVYDYELFSRAKLQRDLARVERYYRARGYYDAHATAGLVTFPKPEHVRVDIYVEEGPPVVTQPHKIEGLAEVPKAVADAVLKAADTALPQGAPFDEDKFEQAENDVHRALTDHGYAYAKVKRDALVDVVRHTGTAVFTLTPDRPAVFGKITIEGRTAESKTTPVEIPEAPMRRALDIAEGEPYSTKAIED